MFSPIVHVLSQNAPGRQERRRRRLPPPGHAVRGRGLQLRRAKVSGGALGTLVLTTFKTMFYSCQARRPLPQLRQRALPPVPLRPGGGGGCDLLHFSLLLRARPRRRRRQALLLADWRRRSSVQDPGGARGGGGAEGLRHGKVG